MRTSALLWLTLGIMLSSAGCGGEKGESDSGYYEVSNSETLEVEPASPERKDDSQAVERKLIKQGRVEF